MDDTKVSLQFVLESLVLMIAETYDETACLQQRAVVCDDDTG